MEKNFLQREEEFHKLNSELEQKTKELLKEVEGVKEIQERLSKTEISTCTTLQNPAGSSVYMPAHGGTGDEVLPDASYGMGNDGITRFLRAKVKGLQNELEILQAAYKKRTEDWRKVQAEMKTLEEDRNKWQQQAGVLIDSLKQQETLASSTVSKHSQQESENISLKKELESTKKELRTAVQTLKANEMRLNRSLEELEKLRTIVHSHERDDKELRDLARKKEDEVAVVMKRLEKQKSELLLGFKKQMQLIDNLKKQKAHLQAACKLQFSEEEFLKILDWSPSSEQHSEH
ncbi:testis-expressed protein 9 isoform X2 [Zootermopsis nevadensis]|uniref:testis-expressed protein 9 isoform X2 n=1 Tax=Zootermopsis nevadensis TaxID=136037 RepID=UPI000B8E3AEF|nr:testis-expressed protein 9 isoform X2 [Zootermopsis nevadensis]